MAAGVKIFTKKDNMRNFEKGEVLTAERLNELIREAENDTG